MKRLALRDEDLSWREIGDEVVAVDTRTSTYVSANASGLIIWRELALGTTRDALVDRLVEAFDVRADQAAADVDRFLEELGDKGLLAE